METQTRINFLPRKTIYTYKYIICIICKKHVKKWIFKSPCPSYNTRHLHGLTMGSRPATSPGRALNLPVFSPQSWTITGSNAGRRVAVVRFLVASLLEERSDNFLVRWYPHEFFIFCCCSNITICFNVALFHDRTKNNISTILLQVEILIRKRGRRFRHTFSQFND